MKNIRTTIDKWLDSLDKRWDKLPIQKQRQYTLYFFSAYLLLMIVMISKICYDTINTDNSMIIEHILNPVPEKKNNPTQLQDTLQVILKNKTYERK
jgi:hypothetical protein